jgi:hypothetical protein
MIGLGLKEVSFSYLDDKVLKDITLFIENPAGYPPACWREESGSP